LFRSLSRPATATFGLVVIGVVLRLWQYLSDPSLWIDEAALARNIIDRPVQALFGPLDYAQVAPPGFLLIEKAAVLTVGSSEYALRLFPLLCGIAALLTFVRLAHHLFDDWAAPFAAGMFALGAPFVFFASQVKQYSSDILASVVVLAAAAWMRQQPGDIRRSMTVGLVGGIAVFFSQPACFIVAGIGTALALVHVLERPRPAIAPLAVVGIMWGLAFSAAVVIGLRAMSPTDRLYMHWYWGGGFWPIPPRNASEILWPFEQLTYAFGAFGSGPRRTNGGLNYPWSPLFAVMMLVGLFATWKKRRDVALFLVVPALLTLAASAFQLYPFTGRVLTFLEPGFLLATAAGAQYVLDIWPNRLRPATPALLAILGGSPVFAAVRGLPPERIEHIRPLVATVADRIEPRDAVYVYYGAGQAVLYYAPTFGLARGDLTIGRCSIANPREYLREVDHFRGRPRVWILASHLLRNTGELQTLTDYVDAIGRRGDSLIVPATTGIPAHAAYLFLYDLSDPIRLRTTSADTFAVPTEKVDESMAQWGCYGTQAPVP
jgi:hypothetical protein